MSSSGTLSLDGNSPLFFSSGRPSPVERLFSRATFRPMKIGAVPPYKAFLYRERPAALNPEFDAGPAEDPSRYDGDESDASTSTMSEPSTSSHQLATSGFEPIVPQTTHDELERIEARLRELEKEEQVRNAGRTNVLLVRRNIDAQTAKKRKREDDDFRAITEIADAEEEELRGKKKKLKRESMGLLVLSSKDSPGAEPSPMTAPPHSQMPPPTGPPVPTTPRTPSSYYMHAPPSSQPPPFTQPLPYAGTPHAPGATRRRSTSPAYRQRPYTVKNRGIYDNRHGPADGADSMGRALWKRPSDGTYVYVACPYADCRKADFRTIHGFTVHMTRIHKDRISKGHSSIIETFGLENPASAVSSQATTPVTRVAKNPARENHAPVPAPAPAMNNATQNNAQTNNSTPNPAPNHTEDPVQSRLQEQETGYYQEDMVYSDTDDDEEVPQVKVEKEDVPKNNKTSAEPSEPAVKDGDIIPGM